MRGGDRGLELVRPGPAQADRALEHPEALVDAGPVPERAVLVVEEHELPVRADARRAAGVLEEHEREQPEHLGLVGHEHGEELPETDRLVAELLADVVAPGRRRVALVEHEVEDGEDGA